MAGGRGVSWQGGQVERDLLARGSRGVKWG